MTDETDGVSIEALQEVTYKLTEVEVLVGCPNCGWSGVVQLYDIGDGPEWCCRSCDQCFPSNPTVGDDGKTIAERTMLETARQHQQQKRGSTTDGTSEELCPTRDQTGPDRPPQ